MLRLTRRNRRQGNVLTAHYRQGGRPRPPSVELLESSSIFILNGRASPVLSRLQGYAGILR